MGRYVECASVSLLRLAGSEGEIEATVVVNLYAWANHPEAFTAGAAAETASRRTAGGNP